MFSIYLKVLIDMLSPTSPLAHTSPLNHPQNPPIGMSLIESRSNLWAIWVYQNKN